MKWVFCVPSGTRAIRLVTWKTCVGPTYRAQPPISEPFVAPIHG